MAFAGDVIRGGRGDDRISANTGEITTAPLGLTNLADYHYLYGDEGNDYIWGEDQTHTEFIRGGEGHDYIYGGSMIRTETYLYGDAGDDWIYPGSDMLDDNDQVVIAKGGKGNDVINYTVIDGSNDIISTSTGNRNERFYGGDGDDYIWGGQEGCTDTAIDCDKYIFGGAGNDYIVPAINTYGGANVDHYYYGNGGKDTIDYRWYDRNH